MVSQQGKTYHKLSWEVKVMNIHTAKTLLLEP